MSKKPWRLQILLLVVASLAVSRPGLAQRKPTRSSVVKERINPSGLSAPAGYSHVVTARGGKTVYVSGQVALDAKGNLVGKGDLHAQAEQAYANLKIALAAAGAGYGDVVRLNTYVVGYKPSMLDTLRQVRTEQLGEIVVPASTLLGVQALAREGFLIEVEAVAVVD